MAKLTRKLWAGIGVATLTGVAFAPQAIAQDHGHAAPAKAAATPDAGGEAYLTDGGPRDTRIRFYRDIGLIRGHLLVGGQLIELGLWDEALPHFLHPTEELYGGLEKYIKGHNIRPFKLELGVLAQAVKAKRKGAYEQALKVAHQRLDAALAKAKEFMHPVLGFTAKSAAEMLKVALSEYESSIEDGRFTKPVEYQDSRGFVLEAERMIEAVAPALARADAAALAKVRAAMRRLKQAWPEPMPP
ncbi:MAG TPA: hypothetical protein VG900_15750, partial [Hyphomicrobiaceae bacterium]|nr:hypothetical protein [Hyphomicrobiaceae bacterium]